ncbi:hypothetical protein GCM10018953_33610 [Streptosporangium nondiastaticum]
MIYQAIVGQVTTPRLLSCVVITALTLCACTAGDREPAADRPATGAGADETTSSSGTPAPAALTAEEYRSELEKARGPVRDALRKLAATDGPKSLDGRLERTSTTVNDAVTRLAELTPPTEVRTAHDAYLTALRRFAAAFDTARQEAQNQEICTGPAVLTRMEREDELTAVREAARSLSGYPADVVPVKAAAQRTRRLPNGRYVRSESRTGRGYLELRNGNRQDAVVVVVRGKKKVVTVYVRKKSKFKVRGVRDGSYKVYYTLGDDWDSRARTFTRSCAFERFEKALRFRTTYTATQISWKNWTLTLNPVVGGNARSRRVKPGDFPT